MGCSLASRKTGLVERERYYKRNGDFKRLIHEWLDRGVPSETDDAYEGFIYLWIGFNAWAACVTNEDRDKQMVHALALDRDLNERFATLVKGSARLRESATTFHALWPIFRVQKLRELGVPYDLRPVRSRAEFVDAYLRAGATHFEPNCWASHIAPPDGVPLDWAHTIKAIYRVRCNLFHGEKASTSEDDQQIVLAARDVLSAFLEEGELMP